MKIAFIYGGQGSQVEAMGKDLYDEYSFIKDFYDSIEGEFPFKEISFNGDLETVSKTQYTQPILLAFQIAVSKILEHYGILPDIALGLSLGEYSALYTSKVLDEKDAFKIIQYRSKEMDKRAKNIDSRMLAIFSDDIDLIDGLCKKFSDKDKYVQISNINTKGQIVISGDSDKVGQIRDEIKNLGLRSIELNTSGPFHTSYMDEVSDKLENYFKEIEFKEAKIPIIYNYLGDFNKDDDIKNIMAKQVSNRVNFKSSLEKLIDEKPDLIIEIGHKNVIKGFMKRLDKNLKVISVNNIDTIKELLKEIENYGI